MAKPIPAVEPVTSAFLFVNCKSIGVSFLGRPTQGPCHEGGNTHESLVIPAKAVEYPLPTGSASQRCMAALLRTKCNDGKMGQSRTAVRWRTEEKLSSRLEICHRQSTKRP